MDNTPLIIDTGAYTTKAGFASDDHPRAIFPSIIGRPKYLKGRIGKEYYDVFVGDDAAARSDDLEISRPMNDCDVRNWDDMERLWHHVFYRELRIAPEERAILLSSVPQCSIKTKEKMCEIMFETLNVPGVFVASSALLCLYSSGRSSGLVVDSGHSCTHLAPIYEGASIKCGHSEHHAGGKFVTNMLIQCLLKKHIFSKSNWKDLSVVEDIKRKYCLVTKEHDVCPILAPQVHKLPDGKEIKVLGERYLCTDQIFARDSSDICLNTHRTLPEEAALAVRKCDAGICDLLFRNVVLCGGNSLLPNLPGRLRDEVAALVGDRHEVAVHSAEERGTATWLGGSIFAGMSGVMKYWLQKKQYEEGGARAIRIKFM